LVTFQIMPKVNRGFKIYHKDSVKAVASISLSSLGLAKKLSMFDLTIYQ